MQKMHVISSKYSGSITFRRLVEVILNLSLLPRYLL